MSVCGAPSLEDRFQTEARQAWDKYRERTKRLQGTFSVTFLSLLPVREVTERRHIELKQRNGCALVLRQKDTEKPEKRRTEQLHVINSRYAFSLRRKPSTDGWAISKISAKSRGKDVFQDPPNEDVDLWSTIPINFALAYTTLGVIPVTPEFSLKRVSLETGRGGTSSRLSSSMPHPKINRGSLLRSAGPCMIRLVIGSLLALMCNWRGQLVEAGRGTRTVSYEYQDTADGYQIPRRIVVRGRSVLPDIRPDGIFEYENTYDFDFREGDVPESDFTLSAFGLPEPTGMGLRKSSRWYLWFIAGGVICLGVVRVFPAPSPAKKEQLASPRRTRDAELTMSTESSAGYVCSLFSPGSPCWRWQRVPISRRHLVPA